MNPYRLWALISQGVLRVAERFFGGPTRRGGLIGALRTYLGPGNNITQAESNEIGRIARDAISAANQMQATGQTPTASLPQIPTVENATSIVYNVAVNVIPPNAQITAGEHIERVITGVISERGISRDEAERLAEIATRTINRSGEQYERLRRYLNMTDVQIQASRIISAYQQTPIQEM